MSEEAISDPADDAGGAETTASASDSDISRLMSSATLVILGQILYAMSNLLERVVIANTLSRDAYGQVGIGLSVLVLGTTFGLFGSQAGAARYLSRFSDETRKRGVLVTGGTVGVVGSLVVTAVLLVNLDLLATYLLDEGDSTALLGLFVLAIPIVSMLKLGVAFIRGMENTLYRTYAQQIVYPGMRLALLVAFLGLGWGIAAAGYAYMAAGAVGTVVAFALFGRLFPLRGTFETNFREMMAYSAPLVFSGFATTLLSRADTLMVGFFRSNIQVAYYDAAYPLAAGLTMFLHAFGFMYFPLVSRLDAEDRTEEVNATYKLTTKWSYLLTFPVFLLFFVFSDDVLRLVFTPEYREAGIALSILAFGFFVVAATGRCTETLSAFGKTRTILVINVSTLLVNIAMNLVLIPEYGFVGAAVASVVAYIGMNVAYVVVLWAWFDITPFSSATLRTFAVLPLALLPPFLLLARTVQLSPLTLGLLVGLLPVLSLAVYLAAGCTESEDRIAVDLVEEKLGRSLPFVDRVIPPRED